MHNILCFSGGIDSVVAYYYLHKKLGGALNTIYFLYNENACKAEYRHLVRHWNIESIIDQSISLPDPEDGSAYVPNRNLLFAARAAAQYRDNEYVTVWMAGLKDDMVEDKTPAAFDLMSECLTKTGRKQVKVDSPFWDWTKVDILKWFLEHSDCENPKDTIEQCSFSCYNPTDEGEECRHCKACYRKACAMYNAGYPWRFGSVSLAEEYYRSAMKNRYIPERCLDIIRFSLNFMDKPTFDYSKGYEYVKKS